MRNKIATSLLLYKSPSEGRISSFSFFKNIILFYFSQASNIFSCLTYFLDSHLLSWYFLWRFCLEQWFPNFWCIAESQIKNTVAQVHWIRVGPGPLYFYQDPQVFSLAMRRENHLVGIWRKGASEALLSSWGPLLPWMGNTVRRLDTDNGFRGQCWYSQSSQPKTLLGFVCKTFG